MSDIRDRLAQALAEQLSVEKDRIESMLAPPKRLEHGDLALPCFLIAKERKCPPPQVAKELAETMTLPTGVQEAVPMGPFLNFRFDRAYVAKEVIEKVLKEREAFGQSEEGRDQTILVDFSSPNIAKPFHVGHLRSTLIGASLSRIFRFLGHPVHGINHLGDWGTQFGLVYVGCERWGKPKDDHPDPVQALVEVYQKASKAAKEDPEVENAARAWFKALEDGDAEAQAFWEYARKVSLDEFQRIYERLGVDFDDFRGESFYNDKMDAALERVRESGVGSVSEGSFGVDLGEKLGFAMLQKQDGATLYLTRDLAAAAYRFEHYGFAKALYVVGVPQSLHFQQLIGILGKLDCEYAEKLVHVPFGHVEGMSTRSGGAIPLKDFLDEGKKRALAAFQNEVRMRPEGLDEEEVAEQVSLSAIVFNDLSRSRIKDVKFDWDQALSFRGDTGPYLQYAHARINGIERKAGISVPQSIDGEGLVEDVAYRLITEIARFPEAVRRAAREYEPSLISQYLLDLAHAFSSANDVLRVKDEPEEVAGPRLALFAATREVLASGLRLLGIPPVERM